MRRLLIGVGVVFVLLSAVAAIVAANLAPAGTLPVTAARANAAEVSAAGGPTIVVSGLGEVKAKPNVAYVNVGVQVRGATAREAQAEASRQMASVIAKLKAMGIEDKDIQTSNVTVWPINEQTPETISGYMATNTVNVTVNEIDRAGEILDGAIEAGANTAGGISFSIKDPTELRLQAIGEAVRNARPKGDAIAQAMGVQIKGVQSIMEDRAAAPIYEKMAVTALADGRGGAPVMPGELTITAGVIVTYTY